MLRLVTIPECDPVTELESELRAEGAFPRWLSADDGDEWMLCRATVHAPEEEGAEGVHVFTGWRLGYAEVDGVECVAVQPVVDIWAGDDVASARVLEDGPALPLRGAPYAVRVEALRELGRLRVHGERCAVLT